MNNSRGFTLLETLIALLVAAVAVLGMALLLQQSLAAQGHGERSQRALQLNAEIAAAIAANAPARAAYVHAAADPPPSAPACAASAACDPVALAGAQLHDWLQRVTGELPGRGTLAIAQVAGEDGTTLVTIRVQWDEPDGPAWQESALWLPG